MDNDNKNTSGAPSSDTTSALFVSARKKQIEQQETERLAKEKEEKRLAAEAEVRRLEQEVADRKRKAEEDAAAAEIEARRVAAESKAKVSNAAANPDAVLGAGKPAAPASPAGGGINEFIEKLKTNRQLQIIAGSAVLGVIVIVVVLVVVLGGSKEVDVVSTDGGFSYNEYGEIVDAEGYIIEGDGLYVNEYGELVDEYGDVIVTDENGYIVDYSGEVTEPGVSAEGSNIFDGLIPGEGKVVEDMGGAPEGQFYFTDDSLGLSFYYPDYWQAVAKRADPTMPFNMIMLRPAGVEEQTLYVMIADYTKEYNAYVDAGGLDGDEALVGFITKVMGAETLTSEMFGEFIFHDVVKEENGTYSYSCEFTSPENPDEFGWAYISVDDSIQRTHAVYVTGTVSNYNFYIDDINVITESLVSHSVAVG